MRHLESVCDSAVPSCPGWVFWGRRGGGRIWWGLSSGLRSLVRGSLRGRVERSWQCVIVGPEVVDEMLVAEEEEEEGVNDDAEFELVAVVEVGS